MNVFDLVLLIAGGVLIFTGMHFLLKSKFSKSAIYGGVGLTMLVPAFLHENAIEVIYLVLLIVGTLFIFAAMRMPFLLKFDFGKCVMYASIGLTMLAPGFLQVNTIPAFYLVSTIVGGVIILNSRSSLMSQREV